MLQLVINIRNRRKLEKNTKPNVRHASACRQHSQLRKLEKTRNQMSMSDTLQLVVNIRNYASVKKHETHMSDMLQLVVNIRNCASLKNAKPHVRHLIVRF